MLELSTYGSVGVPGGQPPGSTRKIGAGVRNHLKTYTIRSEQRCGPGGGLFSGYEDSYD